MYFSISLSLRYLVARKLCEANNVQVDSLVVRFILLVGETYL